MALRSIFTFHKGTHIHVQMLKRYNYACEFSDISTLKECSHYKQLCFNFTLVLKWATTREHFGASIKASFKPASSAIETS